MGGKAGTWIRVGSGRRGRVSALADDSATSSSLTARDSVESPTIYRSKTYLLMETILCIVFRPCVDDETRFKGLGTVSSICKFGFADHPFKSGAFTTSSFFHDISLHEEDR